MPSPICISSAPPTYNTVGKLKQWTNSIDDETPVCRTISFKPSSSRYRSVILAISHKTHTLLIFHTSVEWETHLMMGVNTWNDKWNLHEIQIYIADYIQNTYAIEVCTPSIRSILLCPSDSQRTSWITSMIHGGATLKTSTTSIPYPIPHTSITIGKHGWLLKKSWFQTWERRFYRTITINNETYLTWSQHIDTELISKDDILLSHGAIKHVVPSCEVPLPPYVLQDSYCEFEITISKNHKKLYFRCDSIIERDSWIHVLRTLASHDHAPQTQEPTTAEYKQIQQGSPTGSARRPTLGFLNPRNWTSRTQRSASVPSIITSHHQQPSPLFYKSHMDDQQLNESRHSKYDTL